MSLIVSKRINYRRANNGIEYFPKYDEEDCEIADLRCKCCGFKSMVPYKENDTIVKCPKCKVPHQISDFK